MKVGDVLLCIKDFNVSVDIIYIKGYRYIISDIINNNIYFINSSVENRTHYFKNYNTGYYSKDYFFRCFTDINEYFDMSKENRKFKLNKLNNTNF